MSCIDDQRNKTEEKEKNKESTVCNSFRRREPLWRMTFLCSLQHIAIANEKYIGNDFESRNNALKTGKYWTNVIIFICHQLPIPSVEFV